MPYIKKEDRDALDKGIGILLVALTATGGGWRPGHLNYAITKLCLGYMDDVPNYSNFNKTIGVLECVKLEFYRRAVVPYEEKKCSEAGDVY